MSYAEEASKAAPSGEIPKIPSPPELNSTNDPKGSVSIVEQENDQESSFGGKAKGGKKTHQIKKDFPKLGEEAHQKEKEIAEKLKKEYDESQSILLKYYNKITGKLSQLSSNIYNSSINFTVNAKDELQNPVVATQTAVTIAGVGALIFGIQERSRIFGNKTDNEITAILSGLAGLVVLDGILFKRFYSKYDKTSKK
ncbi:hypothetical protein WICMUC_001218 [Wickerhamomyces mucosus]|uniref:Mitochondrial outer membrane protein OM14 C-terminal domain-containing protein n=1 Tax=Wickerhamomyces mucosus TaxID=1378264 RepID=A0A9P8TGT1_9ASCO|nr:hypothetical protein WICMUC_001218 [Wickerhamomyces mucosus]